MTTESNVNESRSGIRSYRGRSLDEILPQIRAELGADAVILREREGLIGGVGGFFAQRFIEVEARRGDGQSIDVYDDYPELEAGDLPGASGLDMLGLEPPAPSPRANGGASEPITIPQQAWDERPDEPVPSDAPEGSPAPPERHEPRPFVPPSVSSKPEFVPARAPEVRQLEPEPEVRQLEPEPELRQLEPEVPQPEPEPEAKPAPTPRRFETNLFMERLREASAMLPDEAAEASLDVNEPRLDAMKAEAPVISARPELGAAKPEPGVVESEPGAAKPEPGVVESEPGPDPLADLAADIDASEAIAALRDAAKRPIPERETPRPTAARPTPPRPTAARPTTARPTPPRPTAARPTPPRPPAARPTPPRPTPPRPPAARPTPPRPTAARPTALPAAPPLPAVRQSAPNPLPAMAEQLLPTLGRLFGRRRPVEVKPPPPQSLDVAAAGAVARSLINHGASQAWTQDLINVAGAHGNPLADGLRAAAQAELARRILPPPALPAGGAAVAYIGAGGSGKTRCTAAMASAYRRSSTLRVTVVALDNPDGARELSELLKYDGVPVLALSGDEARRAVQAGRQGGLVIVDAPATTPTDPTDVEVLGAKLTPLELDATYVALPATLAPNVAANALASFAKLKPAAVTVTHADETDQLAAVVEITMRQRIPLAHIHAGTDHRHALTAVDPGAVARELLT